MLIRLSSPVPAQCLVRELRVVPSAARRDDLPHGVHLLLDVVRGDLPQVVNKAKCLLDAVESLFTLTL